jgi:hypothetical protein
LVGPRIKVRQVEGKILGRLPDALLDALRDRLHTV